MNEVYIYIYIYRERERERESNTMEHQSATRKKEILTFMTTGMNLESMLNKMSDKKRTTAWYRLYLES